MNEEEKINAQDVNGTPVNEAPQEQPIYTAQPEYVYARSTPPKSSNVSAEITSTLQALLEVFKNPVNAMDAYVKKASWITSLIITGIYAVLNIIFALIDTAIEVNSWPSNLPPLTVAEKVLKFVLAVFGGLLIPVAEVAVIAALAMLFVQIFGKSKLSFFEGLSIASVYAAVMIPVSILEFLLGLIGVGIEDIFTSFGIALGTLFVTIGISAKQSDKNKLPYIVAITFAAVTLAGWVLEKIFL